MAKKPDQPPTRTVDVVDPSYQPNREQLREDLRVDATFEELSKGRGPAGQGTLRQADEAEALTSRSSSRKNSGSSARRMTCQRLYCPSPIDLKEAIPIIV